jgi:hypothetical protein
MLGMLGISQESMWIVIVVLVGVIITAIMLGFFASQGQEGFAYDLFRKLWYDVMYFFFGPRLVEV